MKQPQESQAIILFDGSCNLCHFSVRFVQKYDKENGFVFMALQSDVAKKVLLQYSQQKITDNESIVLLQNKKVYTESTAILVIAKRFRGLWKSLQVFWIVPKFIRDAVYRYIAKRRYTWFGSCPI